MVFTHFPKSVHCNINWILVLRKIPQPGIEPGSRAWQARVLTIILLRKSLSAERLGRLFNKAQAEKFHSRDLNPGLRRERAKSLPLDYCGYTLQYIAKELIHCIVIFKDAFCQNIEARKNEWNVPNLYLWYAHLDFEVQYFISTCKMTLPEFSKFAYHSN